MPNFSCTTPAVTDEVDCSTAMSLEGREPGGRAQVTTRFVIVLNTPSIFWIPLTIT